MKTKIERYTEKFIDANFTKSIDEIKTEIDGTI